MNIKYGVVEISGRDGAYTALLVMPEPERSIGPDASLKKLIQKALTPDDRLSPRAKAAFVAIEKMSTELGWDEAKVEAALPAETEKR